MTLLTRFDRFQFESIEVKKDIRVDQGDSRLFMIKVVDKDTLEPIDITGAQIYLTVVESFVDPEYNRILLEKTAFVDSHDLYVQDGPGGIFVWKLRALDTINLVPREYPYTLVVSSGAGSQTVMAGNLRVRRSVGKLSGKYFPFAKGWRGIQVDGTRYMFELDKVPHWLLVSVDGIIQTMGEDFIMNGKVIEFINGTPSAGAEIDVQGETLEP